MRIIWRAEWGARHPNGFRAAPLPAQELWLHHTVTLAPDLAWIDVDRDGVDDDEERAMRAIEDIGQSRFGGGFSYGHALPPSGRIYEGHGVGRQGAHTRGRNDRARAIVLIGNYEDHAPTAAQIRSAAWLIVHGYRQGWWTVTQLSGGHQQAPGQDPTACPGRHALAAIPEINRLAAAYLRGEIDLDQEDDDMQLTDKVRLFSHDTGKVQEYTLQDAFYGIHIHAKEADRKIARVEAKLDALAGTLSNDEANIVAAVRAQPTGGHVDVGALAPALAAALAPLLPDGVNQGDIEEALANVLCRGVDSANPTT
jgi:hypothetical protein